MMTNRLFFKMIVLLVPLAAAAGSGNAHAAACTSLGTGNWSNPAIWDCGVVPGAADTVTIASLAAEHVVTVDVNSAAATVTFTGGARGSQLTLSPGITLNVTGAITINPSTSNPAARQKILAVGSGILNAASIQITGGTNASRTAQLTVSTGTITTTGSITFGGTAAAARLISTGASTINIGGDLGSLGTLTTTNTGTINFNGAAAQNIGAYLTYNNVTVNKSAGTATLLGATTMTGALTVASGTLDISTFALNVAGNLTVNGAVTGTTGITTLSGAGTTIDGTGSITTTTGALTIPAAKSIAATANLTIASPIAITAAVTVTNNGTITSTSASGITDVAGAVWVNAAGSTLNVSGPLLGAGTLSANAAVNTVNYTGAAQTVNPAAYYHLTLSGSGAKSMTGVTAIGGDLAISGTATMTANAAFTVAGALNYSSTGATTLTAATPISIGTFNQTAGTFIDNGNTITVTGTGANTWAQSGGTFTPTGTVIFTGAAPQIGTSGFNNLTINLGAGNSATLTGNATVASLLTLTSGLISTGANTLEVASSCATGVGGGSAASYVLGNLRLHYPTNAGATTCTFPVGDAISYAPATVAMTNVTSTLANSSLTARTDPGDHADTTAGASGIDAAKSVNRYWTLVPGASLSFAAYDTTFSFAAGDIDGAAATANFIIGRKSGSSWYYPALGAKNPTDTTATGMTQAGGFGEFVVGERVLPSITMLKTVAIYSDPVNVLVDPKFIPGAIAQYTVIASNSGGPADSDSTFIDDPVPANTALYVSDIGGAGSGPVAFAQGASSSTLTYTFTALNDMADDVSFSNDGGATWTAVPVADAFGCDATITHIRVNPKGSFAGSAVAPNPGFQLTFRVCVQ